MDHYAGIDVSLECSSVCVVDANGKILREAKVASEPKALIAWFRTLGFGLERIGLEAGPLSQWLFAAMKTAGLTVELLETRHVRDAFKAMPVKSDPQRCARDCAADAAGLVPAGALQISERAREAGNADGPQVGAIEASRRGKQPAGDPARLWS
jgi:transposase